MDIEAEERDSHGNAQEYTRVASEDLSQTESEEQESNSGDSSEQSERGES
jgi:hypothetical protein